MIMEDTKEAKKNRDQVTFRAAEIKEKLDHLAEEKGISVAEAARLLIEQALQDQPARPRSKREEDEDVESISAFLRENNERQDVIISLLGKLVELNSPNVPLEEGQFSQEELDSEIQKALAEQEETLMEDNLIIKASESQKALIHKLLAYRQEKGRVNSATVEDLFFFMFKETFFESWNHKHPGFDEEFKEAFAENLNTEGQA